MLKTFKKISFIASFFSNKRKHFLDTLKLARTALSFWTTYVWAFLYYILTFFANLCLPIRGTMNIILRVRTAVHHPKILISESLRTFETMFGDILMQRLHFVWILASQLLNLYWYWSSWEALACHHEYKCVVMSTTAANLLLSSYIHIYTYNAYHIHTIDKQQRWRCWAYSDIISSIFLTYRG